MSLAIDVDTVYEVLLADGWHKVDWQRSNDGTWASSFAFDAYEYEYGDHSVQDSKNSALGYEFQETGVRTCGPMLAILGVKTLNKEQMEMKAKREEREWQAARANAVKNEAEMAAWSASQRLSS